MARGGLCVLRQDRKLNNNECRITHNAEDAHFLLLLPLLLLASGGAEEQLPTQAAGGGLLLSD